MKLYKEGYHQGSLEPEFQGVSVADVRAWLKKNHQEGLMPQGWIKLASKRPKAKPGVDVLVLYKNGTMNVRDLYCYEDDHRFLMYEITHWMPLPGLPK